MRKLGYTNPLRTKAVPVESVIKCQVITAAHGSGNSLPERHSNEDKST